MKIVLTKVSGALIPVDQESQKNLAHMKIGKEYLANVTMPRNIKFHKKYFALVNTLFDMQEKYDNEDVFRKMLQIAAGNFDMVTSPDGRKTFLLPKSVSFASMKEDEFSKMYSNILDVAVHKFGIDRETVVKILEYA